MEMKIVRAILNKKERIINTNTRVEIKNDIQKIRLRWFGHVMRMTQEE